MLSQLNSTTPPTPAEVQQHSPLTNNNKFAGCEEKWAEDQASAPRSGKWWYSAFHYVTAMVGAGVLSLPFAMSYFGWGPGSFLLLLSWLVTLYTLWQLIQLHEYIPGKRFDRYYELGQYAFGPKLGICLVLPQQLIVQIGCDIVYMVTGGKCLKKFFEIVCSDCGQLRHSYWICIFASIHVFLSQLPNFNSVAGVSFAAAVMSLSYSTISWVACLTRGPIPNVSYAYKHTSSIDALFRVCSALGQLSFTYAGHGVLLEIQATIPSTPKRPSKIPMWRGSIVAYLIVAFCYFPTAMIGYWAFGNAVEDNILISLNHPGWLIATANMMVVIHVIGSYQVYAMPVFDIIEKILVEHCGFAKNILLRLIARTSYVAFTLLVAVTFPFFSDLLGFFGGLAFAPTSFFLPCIIWLVVKKPRRFSPSWFANLGCIVFGSMITIASTIGGLRNIIVDASTYQFYS